MKVVLSIAGSDSSGGAGIQADIKTISAHHLFAETAITALTAQNTTGVFGVLAVEPAFVAAQIDAVFSDIRPDAVKIGMVSSAAIIEVIAQRLKAHEARNIVLDPVMVATSGASLIDQEALVALKEHLLPLADIITPNMPEAGVLADFEVETEEDMQRAALAIATLTKGAVLVKGGHAAREANDLLLTQQGQMIWLRHKRIETLNTHGTGCSLSSAIACGLACDFEMQASVSKAKHYVAGALAAGLNLGRGSGPLNHLWDL